MTLHWCKEYCRGRPDLIWVSFLQCYIICISPFQFFLETNQTNIRVNQVLMLDFLHELRTITYLTNIRLRALGRTWLWYVRKPGGKIPVSIWPLFVILFFFFLGSCFSIQFQSLVSTIVPSSTTHSLISFQEWMPSVRLVWVFSWLCSSSSTRTLSSHSRTFQNTSKSKSWQSDRTNDMRQV